MRVLASAPALTFVLTACGDEPGDSSSPAPVSGSGSPYGAVKDGLGATLMVWFIEGRVSRRERREIEESVAASFEWR